jgi:hypothetical protein
VDHDHYRGSGRGCEVVRAPRGCLWHAKLIVLTLEGNANPTRLTVVERKNRDRVRNCLRGQIEGSEPGRLRLAVCCFGREDVGPGKERIAISRLSRIFAASGEPGEAGQREELWRRSWGPRRHVDWVASLEGARDHCESGRSPETIRFAFNLPGPPYILLCTKIAREGNDLHLWCRRVLQCFSTFLTGIRRRQPYLGVFFT